MRGVLPGIGLAGFNLNTAGSIDPCRVRTLQDVRSNSRRCEIGLHVRIPRIKPYGRQWREGTVALGGDFSA